MAKNLDALAAALKNINKSAAQTPEDPAMAGTKTEVSADVDLANPAGPDAGAAAKAPEVGAAEPAAEAKSPAGEAASEVPGAKPFVENGGKLASLASLREKLASFGKNEVAAKADPPAEPVKEAAEAGIAPGFTTHKIVNALLKSASGRQLLMDSLAELEGPEKAMELVKLASEEFESFEVALINEKLAAINEAALRAEAEQIYAAQHEAYENLLKTASTEEDLEKIKTSYFLLKRAEAGVIENEEAHAFFSAGAILGEKIAAAMAQDPAAMSQDPAAMEAMIAAQMGEQEGAEPSPEEIMAALEELVQTQQISPEQAQQILDALMGGQAAPEAMPPGMEEMPKEAAEKLMADADAHLEKVASVVASVIEA